MVCDPRRAGRVRAARHSDGCTPDHRLARAAGRHHARGPDRRRACVHGRLRAARSTAMRTPPRLVARTLTVTFITVAVILTVVFIVITLDVRDRVRSAETEKLMVSARVFSALEAKRQQ